MAEDIRVLIVDDHTIVRSGLKLLLESVSGIHVVGEAQNGHQAIEKTSLHQPDLILMDITMPGLDGLEATKLIKERWPSIHILALTMHRSDEYFFEMLKFGASGYLLKGAETEELLDAIRTVARGDVFLYPSMAKKLVQEYLQTQIGPGNTPLTPREHEIMLMLAEGFSSKEIAEKLVLSSSTVHTHRGNIMKKLNLANRRDLMQYARQHGLI